ncbi:MAG: DUF3078 domain-containing protein [bacterium]
MYRLISWGLFFIVPALLFGQQVQQDSAQYGWKSQVIGGLNLTQASFDNWEQGGESSLAWQLKLDLNFTNDQEKYHWANTSKLTLGYAKVGDDEAKKSADEISLESVYTRKLSRSLNPFVAISVKTQFASGFQFNGDTKIKVSKFLDPGYFTQSVGIGYIANPSFKSRLGVTVKETFTNDFPVPYADDPDTPEIEKTKVEPGISSVTNFTRQVDENVVFTSKLDVFTDLEAFNRIDMLWENTLTLKVSKYINVSVEMVLFYDKDITGDLQVKEVLAVGFTYAIL